MTTRAAGPKLSPRAVELLRLIDAATAWEGDVRPGTNLLRYWVPAVSRDDQGVWGSGDAAILRSLERKGLTRRERAGFYSYSITEDGIAWLAGEVR